jgi:hypothetical protein
MRIFFLGQRLILFVRENFCNGASRRRFPSNEFFKRAYSTKFPNRGRTNAFLTCANEHHAANLCGYTISRSKLPK